MFDYLPSARPKAKNKKENSVGRKNVLNYSVLVTVRIISTVWVRPVDMVTVSKLC